jgi:hypothetical protein
MFEDMAHTPKRSNQYPGATVDRLLEKGDVPGAKAELERLLLEGLDSGPGIEATPQFWKDLRTKLHRQASARSRRKTA